jgi:transcriptional regulator with XRE-family HTH domain
LLGRLKALRVERGLTQEEFAEKAGLSYKYYQAVEAGRKKELRLSTLVRLAKAHNLEPWQLLLPGGPKAVRKTAKVRPSKAAKKKPQRARKTP